MGVFSFMETFFFISLGISFVMIIMLVYHFKQRMIVIEHKQDTMFEIINNIVKQIKNMQINITYLGENQNATIRAPSENVVTFSNGFLPTNMHEFDIMFNDVVKSEPNGVEEEEESDEDDDEAAENDEDEDDEEDDDSEDDEEDDEEESDEDDEDDDDEDDEEEEPKKIIVSDDDTPTESTIKVINVDINENTPEANDLGIIEIAEIESTLLKENMEINDEDIVIHKIEHTKTEEVANDSTRDNKEIYKKMSLSVLRATVIEKGLSTDPSKLKKQELVQLLESAE
jgi:hypothetical protein